MASIIGSVKSGTSGGGGGGTVTDAQLAAKADLFLLTSSTVKIGQQFADGTVQGVNAVAVGINAGNKGQLGRTVAIGGFAGKDNQGSTATAVGNAAGQTDQGESALALGFNAGNSSQAPRSIAINATGQILNNTTPDSCVVAPIRANDVGSHILTYNDTTKEVVKSTIAQVQSVVGGGVTAAQLADKADLSLFGDTTESKIKIGFGAGSTSQGLYSVAIGKDSGKNSGGSCVALGISAGSSGQSNNAVAIGAYAGTTDQQVNTVAVGRQAGQTTQGSSSVAIGAFAGFSGQAPNSIVINATGAVLNNTVGNSCVVAPIRENDVGSHILTYNDTTKEVVKSTIAQLSSAVGSSPIFTGTVTVSSATDVLLPSLSTVQYAGTALSTTLDLKVNKGANPVAVGEGAGVTRQGEHTIALGFFAGEIDQGNYSIAMGFEASKTTQGFSCISLGNRAGYQNQGDYSIAIGGYAGQVNQAPNNIVINATGAVLNNTVANSMVVAPIRENDVGSHILTYIDTTKEVVKSTITQLSSSLGLLNMMTYNVFPKISLASSFVGFGDSLNDGAAWVGLHAQLASLTGKTLTKKAVSGTTIEHFSQNYIDDFMSNAVYSNISSIISYGTNDMRRTVGFYENYFVWTQCLLSMVLTLSLPFSKILRTGGTSGGYTVGGAWSDGGRRNTAQVDAYLEKDFGTVRYIAVSVVHFNTQPFHYEISVNGVLQSTFKMPSGLSGSTSWRSVATVIDLCENVANCVIRITNKTSGGTQYVDFISGWTSADLANSRSVLITSIPRYNFANMAETTLAVIDAIDNKRIRYNEGYEHISKMCRYWGLPVSFYRINEMAGVFHTDSFHTTSIQGKAWAKEIIDNALIN